MKQPKTIEEIMAIDDEPVIVANEQGLIEFINKRFTEEYGWSQQDLVGDSLTTIIPTHFRDTHRVGFARFLATEKPTLLGRPMSLAVQLKDGSTADAEHFIMGEKKDGEWSFGAIIHRASEQEADHGRR